MAVNLSPRQLMDTDVAAEVVAASRASLRAIGVRIAIDDFGTGFSGLSYLRRLPADIIRIDRSFVGDLPTGRSATMLIASIVEPARSLGLDVVAEGVGTDDQRLALRALHCGQAQGYFFAEPQPADRAAVHLDRAGSVVGA